VVLGRWPTGGPPPDFDSAQEYDRTVATLVESGVISDPGMIYFDVRPSARYPTLEIRIGDACPLLDDAVLLAAVARALVTVAAADEAAGLPVPAVPVVLLRAASWRAARSGLAGQLVDPLEGRARPAAVIVRRLLEYARPALEGRGDWAVVDGLADEVCRRGTSAQRQRAVFGRTGTAAEVVAHLAAETAAR
jgi:carboxylate-amine ligase